MELNAFLAYCLAAVAIIIVPGPTVTMIVANSLRHGSRAGMLNVAGTQAGLLIWLAVAVFGLAAMIKAMGVWFDVVRIAGAAYLVWLGIALWRSGGQLRSAERARPKGSFFLQGLWVILSNPKMLLVFGALIPQFISPEHDFMSQLIFLVVVFMILAAIFDGTYAVLAGSAGAWLSRARIRLVERLSGTCLIAGGLWLAFRR
jgi:threonine/homoserine/homoserine lactone efflux protein